MAAQGFSHALHLELRDMRIERGGRCVVEHLSFSLQAGQALWLRGANGAGKSTILRVLAGFLPFHGGMMQLRYEGGELLEPHEYGPLMHYLGYQDGLKPTLSVAENLHFWANMLMDEAQAGQEVARVQVALARMGIAHLAMLPAAYLSEGQKKRLALARLVVVPRPLWLMDEPSLTLDQNALGVLSAMMNEHVAQGGIIVFASHMPLDITNQRDYALQSGA